MKRNDVSDTDIVDVLRTAVNIINLNQRYLNLKSEIEYLEQRRSYLSYSPSSPYSLQPLPRITQMIIIIISGCMFRHDSLFSAKYDKIPNSYFSKLFLS